MRGAAGGELWTWGDAEEARLTTRGGLLGVGAIGSRRSRRPRSTRPGGPRLRALLPRPTLGRREGFVRAVAHAALERGVRGRAARSGASSCRRGQRGSEVVFVAHRRPSPRDPPPGARRRGRGGGDEHAAAMRFRPRAREVYTGPGRGRRAGHGGVADEPRRAVAAPREGGPVRRVRAEDDRRRHRAARAHDQGEGGPRQGARDVRRRRARGEEKNQPPRESPRIVVASREPSPESSAVPRRVVARSPESLGSTARGEGRDPLEGREQKPKPFAAARRRGGAVAGFGGERVERRRLGRDAPPRASRA